MFKLLNTLILCIYFIRNHFQKYKNVLTYCFNFFSKYVTIYFDRTYIFIYNIELFVLRIMKCICIFLFNKR